MSDSKETQQELFGEFSATPKKPDRFALISRTQKPILFSTNTEQLLMFGILFILMLCGVFFLGVMRGKALLGQPVTEAPIASTTISPKRWPVLAVTPDVHPVSPIPRVSVVKTPSIAPQEVPQKPYTLQLVTHRKKELAESEMNGLRAQGLYSFIIPSGEYFQVCAGQYGSKEEAKKDVVRFSGKYKDCFPRRR